MRSVSDLARLISNVRYWRSRGYGWRTSWIQAKRTL